MIIDHPLFTQYDYAGKRPEDTTSSPINETPEETTGLQWNTDGWRVSSKANCISLTGESLLKNKQTGRCILTGLMISTLYCQALTGLLRIFFF